MMFCDSGLLLRGHPLSRYQVESQIVHAYSVFCMKCMQQPKFGLLTSRAENPCNYAMAAIMYENLQL